MSVTVTPGSRVTLHYTLQFGDGTLVESTRGQEPATVVIGSGEWLELFESKLFGMTAGERRHLRLPATETVALASGESAQRMPRSDFPAEMDLQAGQVIGFTLPDGREVPGLVLEVSTVEVVVDFDHPLAGRELDIEVEILAIDAA